jgi:hypothetical protein
MVLQGSCRQSVSITFREVIMINQFRPAAAKAATREAAISSETSTSGILPSGIIGSLLGAAVSAPMFPAVIGVLGSGRPLGAASVAVYVATGVWFGAVTGGILGAVLGSHRAG